MASISKTQNGSRKTVKKWRVRWRCPEGKQHEKRFHTKAEAEIFMRNVEDTLNKGKTITSKPTVIPLESCATHYLAFKKPKWKHNTYQQRVLYMSQFVEWCFDNIKGEPLITHLSDQLTLTYRSWLMNKKNPCSEGTANARIRHIENFWTWTKNRDEYHDICPRVVCLELRDIAPRRSLSAPNWEEMDKAIQSAKGWYRQHMMILRFTGLRRGQALRLKWSDFDLQAQTLHVRGALGKSKHEQQGRLMYVSPHLIEHLRLWPKNSEWVIDKRIVPRSREGDNTKRTKVNNRIPRKIWERTDVSEVKYEQPLHCFRKGVNQELLQLKINGETRRYMLGHKTDINESAYLPLDIIAEHTKEVATSIPALTVDIPFGELF